MQIEVGDYKVIGSGSVISIKQESITFYVEPSLPCKIIFEDDSENNSPRVKYDVSNSRMQLVITLVNFNSQAGNLMPDRLIVGYLGDNDDNELALDFVAFAPLGPNGPKVFHYTWLTKSIANQ
jgi:hypothetical protein